MTTVHDLSKGPVFIIGSKRSGTTWLLWLLSSLPDAVGVIQSDFIDELRNLERWWTVSGSFHKYVTGLAGDSKSRPLTDVLAGGSGPPLVDMANSVYSQVLASKHSASWVVESQPENTENIQFIRYLFRRPVFLHIVRDPRDVFASWKHASSSWSTASVFANDPKTFSEHWKRDQKKIALLEDDGELTYVRVKYDDLVTNTEAVLRRVCEQLGVDTNSTEIALSVQQNAMSNIKGHAHMPAGFFRKGVSRGWEKDLRESEIATIEFLLGEQMEQFGYERSLKQRDALPLTVRWREWLRAIFRQIRNSRLAKLIKTMS